MSDLKTSHANAKIEKAVNAFLTEVEMIYARHGMSIGHENSTGAFLIRAWSSDDIDWLRSARVMIDGHEIKDITCEHIEDVLSDMVPEWHALSSASKMALIGIYFAATASFRDRARELATQSLSRMNRRISLTGKEVGA